MPSKSLNRNYSPTGYISNGDASEQFLLQSLITESIQNAGIVVTYIPRTLVSLDSLFGEDRLSQFNRGVNIEMYLKSSMGFGGNIGITKFGIAFDQSVELVVSRDRWSLLIANTGATVLPNRPAEGDLIWLPLTDSLFEIVYVDALSPFFQLGNLYSWTLQCNLFSYSSQKIQTGIADIDAFNTLGTDTMTQSVSGQLNNPLLNAQNVPIDNLASTEVFSPANPFNEP
jgi:hypothetical protein